MRSLVPATVLLVVTLVVQSQSAFALRTVSSVGEWPTDWPKELDTLRSVSRTIGFYPGGQKIHEISFVDRASFEKAWPFILQLKTNGAPLKLYRTNDPAPKQWGSYLSHGKPVVRIYVSTDGLAGPPWPASVLSPKGELLEFVQTATIEGENTWVPVEVGKGGPGFYHRARIDIELVVDEKIIDLNRIVLPSNTPIIDNRSTPK